MSYRVRRNIASWLYSHGVISLTLPRSNFRPVSFDAISRVASDVRSEVLRLVNDETFPHYQCDDWADFTIGRFVEAGLNCIGKVAAYFDPDYHHTFCVILEINEHGAVDGWIFDPSRPRDNSPNYFIHGSQEDGYFTLNGSSVYF